MTEDWFFDLSADPGETENAIKRAPAAAAALKMALENWEKNVTPLR